MLQGGGYSLSADPRDPNLVQEKNVLMNRLSKSWSAASFGEYVTPEMISVSVVDFGSFALGVRVRILLSLLSLSRDHLSKVWPKCLELLNVARDDRDEWVRVVADLVQRRLPSPAEMGFDTRTGSAEFGSGSAASDQVDHMDCLGDDKSGPVDDAIDHIAASLDLDETNLTTGPENQTEKAVIVPEFSPVEFQFLCKELIPEGLELDNTNRHFSFQGNISHLVRDGSALVESPSHSTLPSPFDAQRDALPPSTSSAPISPSSSRSPTGSGDDKPVHARIQDIVKQVDPEKFQRKPAMQFVNDATALGSPATADPIPAGVANILADPANTLLTAETRAEVENFYRAYEGKPNSGEKYIPLCVDQEPIPNTKPPQIKSVATLLKLNYGTNKVSKTKKKQIITFKENE